MGKLTPVFVKELPVSKIRPNPFQPRSNYDEQELIRLCESIRAQGGLIHPITVRKARGSFQIVSGYRRWLAYKRMGEQLIPAIVRNVNDQEMLEIALVENLQRADLNPIEEAEGLKKLEKIWNMTRRDVARKIGKSYGYVSQRVELLDLPDWIQDILSRDKLSPSVAEAIGSCSPEIQDKLRRIMERGWTPTVQQIITFREEHRRESLLKSQGKSQKTPAGRTEAQTAYDTIMAYTKIVDTPVRLTIAVWTIYEDMRNQSSESITEFLHRVVIAHFTKKQGR